MTTDLLDFPPIEAPPPPAAAPVPAPVAAPAPAVAAVPLSIKETVLAQFKDAEGDLTKLAAKYRDVAYDCTTTKGMAEAKAARADLRDNGRLALTKTEARVKADVNDLKRVMAAEVERLVGIVRPVEDAIDSQIKAEEERKAREKAERERIEAERVAGHQARMAKIAGYLTHCQQFGMTAARIQVGIDRLAAVTFGPEWEEFAVPAADLQCKTLEAMRALHAQAVEHEAEALRLEEQRQEQERVAAAQAETQRRLDEAAETLRLQQEAIAQQAADAEASLVASIRAESRRVEWPKNPAYIQKAIGTFECMAPDWENDPREPVREAIAEGRRYLAGLMADANKPAPAPEPAPSPAVQAALAEVLAVSAVISNPPFQETAQPGVQTPAAQGEVAGNLAQPQPVATFPAGDAAAEARAGEDAGGTAVAPAPSVTLTPHQLLLQEACALLEQWLIEPPKKKQAAACFAVINTLRDRGGIPRTN